MPLRGLAVRARFLPIEAPWLVQEPKILLNDYMLFQHLHSSVGGCVSFASMHPAPVEDTGPKLVDYHLHQCCIPYGVVWLERTCCRVLWPMNRLHSGDNPNCISGLRDQPYGSSVRLCSCWSI